MTLGTLTLIPTPLNDEYLLESQAKDLLQKVYIQDSSIIAVEELKVARRRWSSWGLPREQLEKFYEFNEHNQESASLELLNFLQQGKSVYLLSDGGLPAFCDPGTQLINLCHQHHIRVTATSYSNSVSLAWALSGYQSRRFIFEGFPPVDSLERKKELIRMIQEKSPVILMDTPYRLRRLMEELEELVPQREIFLALDLNLPTEQLFRTKPAQILQKITQWKREFVLILSPVLADKK